MLIGTATHIPYLSSNQEEADGRIMYHINDGVVKHSVQSVFVDSPDVFVIFFSLQKHLESTGAVVKLGSRKKQENYTDPPVG